MPLISSFYGMYINSQHCSCLLENQPFFTKDVSCLLENWPFLPKTFSVFWKIGLFYQRR